MRPVFRSLYPALLAVIDLAIGGGLLYLEGVSPLGLLIAAVGVLLICHVVVHAASRTNSAVHHFANGS